MSASLGEKKGWEDLAQSLPSEVCRKSLVSYSQESRKYTLRLLNVDFDVMLNDRAIAPAAGRSGVVPDLGLDFRIMILDYLVNCSEAPLGGRLVSGAQLKGGEFFFRGTHGLELEALVELYGKRPDRFSEIGRSLGGKSLELGDVSFRLLVLPKVSVAYVLWAADEEFSARMSVLFDSSADHMLHLDTLRTAVTTTNKFILVAKPQ